MSFIVLLPRCRAVTPVQAISIMPYGSKITSTFSAVLGIPESTISHVTRSVEIMGGDYLRQLAQAAQKQGIKLTYSHIRELNRMPTDDFAEHRQGIIDRIFSGDIVTHRQVTEEVDKLLGVVRRVEAVYYDSEDVEEPQITSKAEKKASSTAPVKGDALGDLPSDTDIDKLCVQLVDLIQQVDKKFDRIEENIRNWRENVAFETLQDMCMDSLDAASSTVREFTHRITDIGLILDDAMQVATAAAVEV